MSQLSQATGDPSQPPADADDRRRQVKRGRQAGHRHRPAAPAADAPDDEESAGPPRTSRSALVIIGDLVVNTERVIGARGAWPLNLNVTFCE